MEANIEIVEFMLATTPDSVHEVRIRSNDAEGFVGVVEVEVAAVFPLGHDDAPRLDVDVFLSGIGCWFRGWH